MQYDADGVERVVCYQSLQLQAAERNYPLNEKELIATKYALVKCRVYLLVDRPFIVYTDHASLRTAVNSPHLSQRMARWLSFFKEFSLKVEYKPGRLNFVADALSRRPDYEPTVKSDSEVKPTIATLNTSVLLSSLLDDIRMACAEDSDLVCLMDSLKDPSTQAKKRLPAMYRSSIDRYTQRNGLLYYTAVNNDTQSRLLLASPVQVCAQVRACLRGVSTSEAPSFTSFSVAASTSSVECWESVSMDFVFGFSIDARNNNGIIVFVDRFSKMVHLVAVPESITAEGCAHVFLDTIFRLHGLLRELVSDRSPQFTADFWRSVFQSLETRLTMSTTGNWAPRSLLKA